MLIISIDHFEILAEFLGSLVFFPFILEKLASCNYEVAQINPKSTDWDHNPLLEDTVVDPSLRGMIFVDTSFWIAFRNERDAHHGHAKILMQEFFR